MQRVYKFFFLAVATAFITGSSFAQSTMYMGVTNVIFGNGQSQNSGTGIDAIGYDITCNNCANQPTVSPCNGTSTTFLMTNVNGVYFVVMGFNLQDAMDNGNLGNPPTNGRYPFLNSYTFTGNDGTGIPAGYQIAAGRIGTYSGPAANGWSTITVTVDPPSTTAAPTESEDNYMYYRQRHRHYHDHYHDR